ncbi:MAG: type I-E CRISPR-associated protein Cse2/CasB [Anaerolineae bacterium]
MTERELPAPVSAFCERLVALDAGARARFRRCAGRSLAEAGEALGLFYSLLPSGVKPYQEGTFFLVATLSALADGGGVGDLGMLLARARTPKNAKGLDRRIATILDADESQLPFRLRQAVRYLRSSRVAVDWPLLLNDLLYWQHPDRFVQKQWARSYYAPTSR